MNYSKHLKRLHNKINVPLTYKQICDISGLPYLTSNSKSSLFKELAHWCKFEKTSSPTRYIFLEFYNKRKEGEPTTLSLPNDEKKYKEAKDFFIRRKITPTEPLPYPLRNRQSISYVCDFHPEEIHESTWARIEKSIGCPLCVYPFSRFEIMTYLGIEDAQSRVKFSGVEFDIYIPSINTVVEVDGYFYHKDDTKEQIERKEDAAQENNLTFLRIEEVLDATKIGIEGDILYVTPYSTATNSARKKIISNLSKFLPFVYRETLWDEAADYMRENKPIAGRTKQYRQYEDGQLINTYTEQQLLDIISSGSAFGYTWEVE